MREMRLKANIPLRRMAELLDLSAPYVSDMELGRRGWRADMIDDFTKACKTKKPVKEITYGK